MADRNEADALFATKRKKQQEEQAEQERREEMNRKKAEMEAEIRRLEEEARRQKEQQEEARRQAEEEARRVKEEAREAEARAARAEEMAKQARLKQEEVRREEERRTREKKEEEKRARERTAQAKRQEAQKAENKKTVKEKKKADTQPGKKIPVLPLAIGGAAAGFVIIVVICLILFAGGKKGVFESNGTCLASDQVLGYDVYYPDTFEERIGDGGVKLIHGSAEEGDGTFVSIFGETGENMEAEIGSTDPSEILRMFLESLFGVSDAGIYEMTTDSGQTVYCTDYFVQDIIYALDYTEEDEAMGQVAMMILPLEDEYLFAMYGTMNDSYTEPLEETVADILGSIY
ncbi:hypothetical protein [Enterocloster citroniae]|uniref:Uncharacterized protein n=2 Tax=Enterocloster citroniae TaxID=358743 RepID=A0ABV2G4K2_9FIRM|nr:hypothetical protein [Enterocloster citroniae]KMW10438.1 hypothetical protein HMPREF9470_05580 [[Clostridium] citroniae WAL-19142]